MSVGVGGCDADVVVAAVVVVVVVAAVAVLAVVAVVAAVVAAVAAVVGIISANCGQVLTLPASCSTDTLSIITVSFH